jgi:hypothetical protein
MKIKLNYIHPNIEVSDNIAVVGSSAILLDSNYSNTIDSYEDVMRYNRAPTAGFENKVGFKSTIRFCNHHVFEGLDPGNRFTKEGQPKNFIKNLKDNKIIIGNGNSKAQWNNRDSKIDKSSSAYYLDLSFISKIKKEYTLIKEPSVGFIGILLLIENNITPHIFGFGINESIMTHYWEKRNPKVHHHNFNQEREILKNLQNNKKLKLFL